MANITVETLDKNTFIVSVSDGGGLDTEHKVTLTDTYWKHLCKAEISKEDCVKKAFRFLLFNEPKESILKEFELTVIKDYFPTFEQEFIRF